MAAQPDETFGDALKRAITDARSNQAHLARELSIDPGQVSRWATGKAVPHVDTVKRLEEILTADLTASFTASMPDYEVYVSAPIAGLDYSNVESHQDAVAEVVQHVEQQVNALYWSGRGIRDAATMLAPDIATERDMHALSRCSAFLYLQFAEIVAPTSALIEFGVALGRRMKTTAIIQSNLKQAYMLEGFGAVAASLNFLPKARIYRVGSPDEASDLIARNGRQLLGLA